VYLHIPSLKRKKRELKEVRGSLAELEVRPLFSDSDLSYSSACWAVDIVQHAGGDIWSDFEIGVFERSPPHLFLYLLLFKTRKTKVETNKDYANFEHRGV